tara:strand:- start:313 stop:879 length:567 start_codon:yes stop_codon:yes gene_type:complete
MTIVIGYKTDKGVILGADSLASGGWNSTHRQDEKVFTKNGIGYGFTSSYRMGQILQYHSESVTFEEGITPHEYAVKLLVPMWREILKTHGYTTISNNNEEGGQFLVAVRGELFSVACDFQVGDSKEPYSAVGCGTNYALGGLRILEKDKGINEEAKVERALDVAKHFSNGCGGSNSIIFIGKDKPHNN